MEVADAVCGCTHHYSFHDRDGCHQAVRFEVYWDHTGKPVQWSAGTCRCKGYTGPEPIPEWLPLNPPPQPR